MPPESGTRPMPTNPGTNAAALDATRTSQALASESPAPAAGAVDRRDHRLREPADEPDVRVVGRLERVLERLLQLRELAQVLARRRSRGRRP